MEIAFAKSKLIDWWICKVVIAKFFWNVVSKMVDHKFQKMLQALLDKFGTFRRISGRVEWALNTGAIRRVLKQIVSLRLLISSVTSIYASCYPPIATCILVRVVGIVWSVFFHLICAVVCYAENACRWMYVPRIEKHWTHEVFQILGGGDWGMRLLAAISGGYGFHTHCFACDDG